MELENHAKRAAQLEGEIKGKVCNFCQRIGRNFNVEVTDYNVLNSLKMRVSTKKASFHCGVIVSVFIELFRKRLSQTSVKANAAMPIGIMGSDSLVFD